jgi:hypothetical protein
MAATLRLAAISFFTFSPDSFVGYARHTAIAMPGENTGKT